MDVTEWLRALEPSIQVVAREQLPPDKVADGEQEARIAIWRYLASDRGGNIPTNLRGYLFMIAKKAIIRFAAGRPMLGEREGAQGKPRCPVASGYTEQIEDVRTYESHEPDVDLRVDILTALLDLLPWEKYFVVSHYLLDRPVREIADQLGMHENGLRNAWKRRLQPLLAGRL